MNRTTVNELANGKTEVVKLETLVALFDAGMWRLDDVEIPTELVQALSPDQIKTLHWLCQLLTGEDGAMKNLGIVLSDEDD